MDHVGGDLSLPQDPDSDNPPGPEGLRQSKESRHSPTNAAENNTVSKASANKKQKPFV